MRPLFPKKIASGASRKAIWLVAAFAASFVTSAQAASFGVTGYIVGLYVAAANNGAFRVALVNGGTNPLASCTAGMAYIPKSDDNYEAKVAALLSFQAQGKSIYATIDDNGSGDCTIREFGY